MGDFNIVLSGDPAKPYYQLSGTFDESAILPKIKLAPVIVICLGNVHRLNSLGTRTWCNWVREVPSTVQIHVENCPFTFVNAFNDVFGSHPQNLVVQSFYVPFVSETTGERRDILFKRGGQFNEQGEIHPPQILDTLQRPMEMDVLPDYFGFLKR